MQDDDRQKGNMVRKVTFMIIIIIITPREEKQLFIVFTFSWSRLQSQQELKEHQGMYIHKIILNERRNLETFNFLFLFPFYSVIMIK